MTRRPALISFLAYISIMIGVLNFIGGIFYNFKSGLPIDSKTIVFLSINFLYSCLYIVSGYYILKSHLLGWQLGLFNQLLLVTKCYGVLIYIFINISKVDFGTNNISDYLIKYAMCALIGMTIVYYFLNMETLKHFKVASETRLKTLRTSVLGAMIIILVQIATHTLSL